MEAIYVACMERTLTSRLYLINLCTHTVSHASDHCESLEKVLENNPQCIAIDCIGLTCTPPAPFENFTASFTLIECTDPVQVNFTIASSSGAVFTSLFHHSQVVQFGGDKSVDIEMARNATHLDFQVYIEYSLSCECHA